MIEDQEVELNGAIYTWSFDSDVRSACECWRWVDSRNMAAPMALLVKLNNRFLEEKAVGLLAILDSSEAPRLREVLSLMGATDEQLESWGFDAPVQRTSGLGGDGWVVESPLRRLGYQTGERGKPASERQKILRQALEGTLPNVGSPLYMAEWGEPKSEKRLKKMAEYLASMCRNTKKKNPRSKAIDDWEEDLEWLYATFYRKTLHFMWPSANV